VTTIAESWLFEPWAFASCLCQFSRKLFTGQIPRQCRVFAKRPGPTYRGQPFGYENGLQEISAGRIFHETLGEPIFSWPWRDVLSGHNINVSDFLHWRTATQVIVFSKQMLLSLFDLAAQEQQLDSGRRSQRRRCWDDWQQGTNSILTNSNSRPQIKYILGITQKTPSVGGFRH
jgi:hypothetical protein